VSASSLLFQILLFLLYHPLSYITLNPICPAQLVSFLSGPGPA
jgi:hypothetical protein